MMKRILFVFLSCFCQLSVADQNNYPVVELIESTNKVNNSEKAKHPRPLGGTFDKAIDTLKSSDPTKEARNYFKKNGVMFITWAGGFPADNRELQKRVLLDNKLKKTPFPGVVDYIYDSLSQSQYDDYGLKFVKTFDQEMLRLSKISAQGN